MKLDKQSQLKTLEMCKDRLYLTLQLQLQYKSQQQRLRLLFKCPLYQEQILEEVRFFLTTYKSIKEETAKFTHQLLENSLTQQPRLTQRTD